MNDNFSHFHGIFPCQCEYYEFNMFRTFSINATFFVYQEATLFAWKKEKVKRTLEEVTGLHFQENNSW